MWGEERAGAAPALVVCVLTACLLVKTAATPQQSVTIEYCNPCIVNKDDIHTLNVLS